MASLSLRIAATLIVGNASRLDLPLTDGCRSNVIMREPGLKSSKIGWAAFY